MKVFLSFHSRDQALATAVKAGLEKLDTAAKVFFSPVSLGAGFWLPKLAEAIAEADALLLLVGPEGVGPWQLLEYFEGVHRVQDARRAGGDFPLVPLIAGGADVPGLPFIRQLNMELAPTLPDQAALARVLAMLRGEAGGEGLQSLWKRTNPYRGLMAMTGSHAEYFFARERETATILSTLAEKPGRLPLLLGASGVGKSSVAQAGVLTALAAQGWPATLADAPPWPRALAGSRRFVPLVVRPEQRPIENLVTALMSLWQLDPTDAETSRKRNGWVQGLREGANRLSDLIEATQITLAHREGAAPERFVLYVDQGEELHTRAGAEAAGRFGEILAEGLADRRLLAFMSLRVDYLGPFQAHSALYGLHEQIDIAPLRAEGLRQIVEKPPGVLDVRFEDERLVGRLTEAAVGEGAGALPLLSYLMTDMWAAMQKQAEPVLRLPAQAIDIGGVLAARAEAFLAAEPAREPALRRLLTLRLASVPEEGRPVRRQAGREECTAEEWALAAELADASTLDGREPLRLVVIRADEAGRLIAEVAHERLLEGWTRLGKWLDDEREFLVFKAEAERREKRWRSLNRSKQALLFGIDLARAANWIEKNHLKYNSSTIEYINESLAFEADASSKKMRNEKFKTLLIRIIAIFCFTLASLSVFTLYFVAESRKNEIEKNAHLQDLILKLNQQSESADALTNFFTYGDNFFPNARKENFSRDLLLRQIFLAESGNQYSQNLVGLAYLYGIGTEVNIKEAIYWFSKASNLGNAAAMRNIAWIHMENPFLWSNKELVLDWLSNAEKHGDRVAMRLLGMYYSGYIATGVQNLSNLDAQKKAMELYRRAIALGDIESYQNLIVFADQETVEYMKSSIINVGRQSLYILLLNTAYNKNYLNFFVEEAVRRRDKELICLLIDRLESRNNSINHERSIHLLESIEVLKRSVEKSFAGPCQKQ